VSSATRVDPTFIPQIVATTNYELARSVLNQLELRRPGLTRFMRSWNSCDSTMPVIDLQERLRKLFDLRTIQETNPLFDDLFNFGLVGIATEKSVQASGSRTEFKFGFVGDRVIPNIHTTLDGGDFVALSPMLHEYCGCSPSEYGAVVPIA